MCVLVKCEAPENIHIPTPWKVNGNSEGVGGLKGQNFKRKVWGLSENSRGVGGGFKPKILPWEVYGYFLEQHNGICICKQLLHCKLIATCILAKR